MCVRVCYVPCSGCEYVRCLSSSAPLVHPGPLAHVIQNVKFPNPLWIYPAGPAYVAPASSGRRFILVRAVYCCYVY